MSHVVMSVGIPGIGKTTLLKSLHKEFPDALYLSSDEMRKNLTGDESNHSVEGQVWGHMVRLFTEALQRRQSVFLDACFVKSSYRSQFLNYIRKYNPEAKVLIIVFPVDEHLARQQSQKRVRKVPSQVISKMYKSFQPPTIDELEGLKGDIQLYSP